MEVLEGLSATQGDTLSGLAEALGHSPATVYRILVTLESRGLVEFQPDEQLWYIGPQAFIIGSRYLRRTSLMERARPILRKLMEDTGETANLGIEKEGNVLFLGQVETHATIRAFFPPGTLSPMHSSGIGKAILAYMDEPRLERLLSNASLEQFTDHTITSLDALRTDLADTHTRGFAFDNEEKNTGMRCIAAPVFGVSGEVLAGISISGPTSRIDITSIEDLSRPVIEAAENLTTAIGGVVPD